MPVWNTFVLYVILLCTTIILNSYQFSLDLNNVPDKFHSNVHCRDREHFVVFEELLHETLIVELEGNIGLACRFCDEETDDGSPKVWYRRDLRNPDGVKLPVEISMAEKYIQARIFVTPDHTLYIASSTSADAGVYYCLGPDGEQLPDSIEYHLDVIDLRKVETIKGNDNEYDKYLEVEFKLMNERFKSANEPEYQSIRKLGIIIRVISDLSEDTITECDGCTGVRQLNTSCRLEPSLNVDYQRFFDELNQITLSAEESKLLRQFEVSCYSVDFAKSYPMIGAHLKGVRNFMLLKECWAPCRKAGLRRNQALYVQRLFAHGGTSVTIVCPGAKPESKVTWLKNGRIIKPPQVAENMFIDPFSTLYIMSVTKYDNGNYTCIIRGERILETTVSISNNANALESSLHEIYYLTFTIIMAFIIYLAVIVVLWTKRYRFYTINYYALENPSVVELLEDLSPSFQGLQLDFVSQGSLVEVKRR